MVEQQGGTVWGLAYAVRLDQKEDVLKYLDVREKVSYSYFIVLCSDLTTLLT